MLYSSSYDSYVQYYLFTRTREFICLQVTIVVVVVVYQYRYTGTVHNNGEIMCSC